jgi:plasmid replication initiation protein
MEIIVPKTKKVYKNNKLNNAAIRLNGSEYKVYLNAIALVGGVDKDGKYLQPNKLLNIYELSAKEFSEQMNINIDNAYRILKTTADKLIRNQIIVEKPELFETQVINIVDSATYNRRKGTIKIQFTQSLMEYLKQSNNNFTLYNLHEVAELTSIYAIRLYELIQQYKTTGYITRSIDQLRMIFGLDETEYKLYGDFKRKVIGQAIKEIYEKTDFSIQITEMKNARKVVALQFTFNPMIKISGFTSEGKVRNSYKRTPKLKQAELFDNNDKL